jgi:hypothetical protein
MNIKELAEQAGLKRHQEQAPGIDGVVGSWGNLERFAELVAAHEREECAKLCQELLERPSGYQGRWEGYGKFKSQMTGQECAEAIRARSKA